MAAGFLLLSKPAIGQTQLFFEDFESTDSNWVFENSADSTSWMPKSGGGIGNSRSLRCSRVTDANGNYALKYFAVFPGLLLMNGHHYTIRFQSKVAQANARRMKLAWNTTPSRNGATLIQDFDTLTNDQYQTFTAAFTASSSQTHYFILYGDNLLNHPVPVNWYVDDVEVFRDNVAPTVSITFPAALAELPEGPTTITASASDEDGSISRVVFYVDEDSVGQDSTAPYELTTYLHPKEEEGQKTYLYARAYDNAGTYEQAGISTEIVANTCELEFPESSRQIICSYDSVEFNAIANNGGKKVQWQHWHNNAWEENEADSMAHTWFGPGIYRAKMKYPNGSTCFTRVDTVATLQITIPTVYIYGSAPALATVIASGGAEPYSYSWSSYETCLNAHCDSVLISDFSNPIVVTVTDQLSCEVSDTVKTAPAPFCIHDLYIEDFGLDTIPDYLEKIASAEQKFQNFIQEMKSFESQTPLNRFPFVSKEIVIPVIFVVFNNPANDEVKNAFLTRYEKQIEILNTEFGKPEHQLSYNGENYRIRFCLAKPNVSGFENGYKIIDHQPYSNFPTTNPERRDRMLALEMFDYRKYYRIVVTESKLGEDFANTFTPTTNHYLVDPVQAQKIDGTYIGIRVFGEWPIPTPQYSDLNEGKVLVHEAGHFLNLFHPYQPFEPAPLGCPAVAHENNNEFVHSYLSQGITKLTWGWDYVKDTPPKSKKWGSCSQSLASQQCADFNYSSHPYWNLNNYMDNAPDACRSQFTPGQVERMFYTLLFYKKELYAPENLATSGIQCGEPLATFSLEKNEACGTTGASATISGHYYQNPALTDYPGLAHHWDVPPGVTLTQQGEDQTFTINFSNPGNQALQITLKVTWDDLPSGISFTQDVFYFSSCSEGCPNPVNNNIYFGQGAGLTWNASSSPRFTANENAYFPFVLPGGAPNPNFIDITGGIVTASDNSGNLLFHAGGPTIWDHNFEKIPVSINCDKNSAQYGVCVKDPNPATSNKFYLFTVPSFEAANSIQGLHYHKLDVGDNGANLNSINSIYNLLCPTVQDYPSINSTARTADKIVAIPKAGGLSGYWIITQSQKPQSGSLDPKFFIYDLNQTGLESTVGTADAGYNAKTGILKASPLGNKILATYCDYTNASDFQYTGAGTGSANPRVFHFNQTTGAITNFVELVVDDLTYASSYGGTFSPSGRYVYVNINEKNSTGSPSDRYAGIYRFDLFATPNDGKIIGDKVSEPLPGCLYSFQLLLTNDNRILISTPPSQGFFWGADNAPPFGGDQLGIIQFPDHDTDPGLTWNGPKLTDNQAKWIRSKTGLPNFIDAANPVGKTEANPINLGQNPGNCCAYPAITRNVKCQGNEHNRGTTGNDLFFKFELKKICGDNSSPCTTYVFNKTLKIDVEESDFSGVGVKLEYLDSQFGWTPLALSLSDGVGIIPGSELSNFNESDEIIQFRLVADAPNSSASGDFKVKVYYRHFDGNSNGTSCCRIAVAGEENSGIGEQIAEKPLNMETLKLFPNPAHNNIYLEAYGEWESYKVVDMQGKIVLEGGSFANKLNLNTSNLANGLYRILAIGPQKSKSAGFQVLK